MTHRATITLGDDSYEFLQQVSGHNRSAYINQLLREAKDNMLKEAIVKANQEEAEDLDYQDSLSEWDVTLKDGLADDSL